MVVYNIALVRKHEKRLDDIFKTSRMGDIISGRLFKKNMGVIMYEYGKIRFYIKILIQMIFLIRYER